METPVSASGGRVRYAAACGGGGGRLTEAQKPLKKKNCLSIQKWSIGFEFR
jgi:hypothetical protein